MNVHHLHSVQTQFFLSIYPLLDYIIIYLLFCTLSLLS